MANEDELKQRIEESEVPLRELGALAALNYQKICDWKKGWAKLKGPELTALENAVNAAIRARADRFNKMLAGIPAQFAAVGA